MEATLIVSSLLPTTTTEEVRTRDIRFSSDIDRLLLAPFGRRNKLRIEGHRGMGKYEPENTLQSFARAIDEELDGIELDVWLSNDNVPVVIHATEIDGVDGYVFFDDGSKRLIYEMTLKEIRAQKILNGFVVPLLDEVFRLAKDKICVNVEFKGVDLNAAVEVLKLCKIHDNIDQVQFSSFNWKFSDALDAARESLGIFTRPPFSFLTEELEITQVFTYGKSGDAVTFDYALVATDIEKFRGLIQQMTAFGFRVKFYLSFSHVELHSDYDIMDTFEVDTVITNEPFLMKRYFERETVKVC